MAGRQGRRSKQLLDDLKEKGGYYELKGEAVDRSVFVCGELDLKEAMDL
jgi:hypothetical protein